jgi:ankyrin repeat protein
MATGKPEQQLKDEALLRAARKGKVSRAGRLLAAGAKADCRDGEGLSPLFYAAVHGFPKVVQLLLDRGADPDVGREIGLGPGLVQAGYRGRLDMLGLLLNGGADINAIDYARRTALHAAVWKGAVEAALLLIEAGADPNTRDRMGLTPLMEAVNADNHELALRLAGCGADASVTDKYGEDLRTLVGRRGWNDVIEAIDKAKADAEENLRRALFTPPPLLAPDLQEASVLQSDLKIIRPLSLKARGMG